MTTGTLPADVTAAFLVATLSPESVLDARGRIVVRHFKPEMHR